MMAAGSIGSLFVNFSGHRTAARQCMILTSIMVKSFS